MNNNLLTIEQLSEKLGYSKGHIYNLVSRNEIPYKKLSRKALRFDPKEIDEWIIERNFQTKKQEADQKEVA
jgi:excisionase family DNA binding protein